MKKILEIYLQHKETVSDINQHIETLYNLGKECSHITEMGVRWVSSTWPLVYSKPNKMVSYDIKKNPNIDRVISLCEEYSINYTFQEKDVLEIEIEPTELHQRVPFFAGNLEMVEKAEEFMGNARNS